MSQTVNPFDQFDAAPAAAAPAAAARVPQQPYTYDPAAPAALVQAATAPAVAPSAPAVAPAPATGAPQQPAANPFDQFDQPTGRDELGGYLLPPEQPSASPQPSGVMAQVDNFGRSVAQGATFGFGDEIAAAGDAATHAVLGRGSDAPSYGERYDANLAQQRARDASIPAVVAIPGQIAGGVGAIMGAAPAAIGRGVLGAARLIPGASALLDAGGAGAELAGNVLAKVPGARAVAPVAKIAAEGAGYGALQGFGEGEGGFEQRLGTAETGAVTGAVLAPVVAGGATLIGKGVKAGARKISEAGFGPKNALADAGGVTPLDAQGQPYKATSGVANVVGQRLADAASDPAAVEQALAAHTDRIPGAKMTTFQASGGDTGLGQKELELRTAPGSSQAFIDRGNEQQAAWLDHVGEQAPQTASSADTVNSLTGGKAALQAQSDAAAAQAARGTLQEVGGVSDGTPSQAGGVVRGAIDQARAPVIAQADQAVQQGAQDAKGSLDALGGRPAGDRGTAQQQYGAGFRAPLDAADQAAKANVTRLADAIDPDGKLMVDMKPIRVAAREISGGLPKNAAKLQGDEADIFDTAAKLPDVQSYQELSALNTRVGDLMRGVRRDPAQAQAYRRLSHLNASIKTAMEGAVNGPEVTAEQLAPRAGAAADIGADAGQAPTTGTTVYTPSNKPVDVRYAVREAGDLTPSQLPDGSPHPDYPPELQPRDRTRAASLQQVNTIANTLTPERLGASTSTAEGAPIVGADGVVESGNARTMAIQQAYAKGGPQAEAYRDWIGQQGYDVADMKAPALVRERTTPMDMPQRAAFAADAGASPVMATSAAERAAADAKRLPDDLVAGYKGGDIADPENRDFVRSFVKNVAPADQASFATADGSLSKEGASRIRAALVHRAYGDDGVTAALSETIDPQAKVLAGAMQDAAGPMARLQAGIKGGTVDPAVDLAPALVEATRVVQQARARGISLADAVAQRDAFTQISPQAGAVLRAAYGENLSGRMSQAKMGDLLTAYAREAEQQSTSGNMFGANLSAEQLLQGASARYGKDTGQVAAATAGQDGTGNAGRIRAGAGLDGDQAQRPVADASGQATPAGGGAGSGDRSVLTESPAAPLTPNFDPEAAARAQAMRDAHRERKNTFGQNVPGVGEILAPGPTHGTFALPESSVPQKIFSGGADGAGRVQAALRAGVKPSEIADYAAFDLRRAAEKDDGTLDPVAGAAWRKTNREPFDALKQADPTIGSSFDTAQQQAQRLVDAQKQRAALDATHPLKPGWGDAEVMAKVWQPGPKGADTIRSITSATGGDPVASASIADYVAYDLRKFAAPNGSRLDPARYDTWIRRFDGALSERPDIKARFDTAAKAQDTLDTAALQHAQALEAYQSGVVKQLLGGADPARTIGATLRSNTAQRDMATLGRLTANDPDARAGIQRAIVDHIFETLKSNNPNPAGAGTGETKLKLDQFQTFMSRAAQPMREVMPGPQVDGLLRVAADMQQAGMSNQVKAGIGSDTTQKALLAAQGDTGRTLMGMVRQHGLTGLLTVGGLVKGGPVGGWIGSKAGAMVGYLRTLGIKESDDLFKQVMLNPGLARVMLSNITPANQSNVASALVSQLSRLAAARGAHAAVSVQREIQANEPPQNALAGTR